MCTKRKVQNKINGSDDMKIAIITGASSGMGREFARQAEHFYKELDEIWVIARRKERLLSLKNQLLTTVRIFEGDLLEEEFYSELEAALKETKADIRMLVNAAGFGKIGKVKEIPDKQQIEMIHLNCIALTHMTKLCIPYMSKGSRIINMASAAAFCPQPSFGVYAATKSYVLSFSRSLRMELKDEQIFVTAVCPGPVATEFFQVAGKKEKNSIKDAVTVKPEKVVKQALLDVKAQKEISVYGIPMKLSRIASKIIPHALILKIMKGFW